MRNALLVMVWLSSCAFGAQCAELKIASSVAFHGALDELGPQFGKEAGVEVKMTFGSAAAINKKVSDGEDFDLVVASPPVVDDLIKGGKVDATTVKSIAKTELGIAAKAGTPKITLETKGDFLNFLQGAKSVGITETASGAASSAFMAKLLPTLNIPDTVMDKVKWTPVGSFPKMVVSGEVQYWITQISEIIPATGVVLVSRLPTPLQNTTVLNGGITTTSKNRDVAMKMLDFLKRSDATLKSKGMEPM